MEDMLRVGVITSTHGVRGGVKVFLATDGPKRFSELEEIMLGTGREQIPLEIEQVRYSKNMVILKPKGYNNINDIEKYKSKDLLVTRDHVVELGLDEYFITGLIGLQVLTEDGEALGVLKDVLETGANDVYVVKVKNDRELLISAIKDCILNVDTKQGAMTAYPLEGLMDLQNERQ